MWPQERHLSKNKLRRCGTWNGDLLTDSQGWVLEILPHLKTTEIIGQRPNTSCLAMTKSEYLILSRCLTLRLIEIRNTPNLNCKTMEPIMQNYVFLTNWTLDIGEEQKKKKVTFWGAACWWPPRLVVELTREAKPSNRPNRSWESLAGKSDKNNGDGAVAKQIDLVDTHRCDLAKLLELSCCCASFLVREPHTCYIWQFNPNYCCTAFSWV